jgi:indole-3-glycerol phosphate synthase
VTNFLEQVMAERRQDVAAARRRVPDEVVAAQARIAGRPPHHFWRSLLADRAHLAVIAEVKRVSPALGALATSTFVPALQAAAYADAGARAISVLTEPRHWGGSLDDLRSVRAAVDIPILAKDIVVDAYQIYEAREAGADAVLLIAEALDDKQLQALVACADGLGMVALVEAHDAIAFGRAVQFAKGVVGVNARNLRKPSELDIGRIRQLHTFAKPHQFLVAESGIGSVDDARMLPARVDAVLVGTALMRADEPAPLIREIAAIRRAVAV